MGKPKPHLDPLDQLSPESALAVLRILARDKTLAVRVQQTVMDYMQSDAPETLGDVQGVAEEVRADLELLEPEEVWDRAGNQRHGYVHTSEAADDMIQRVLESYWENLTRYQNLGMKRAAQYQCMGLLQGQYEFEYESSSEFKDWATDSPGSYASEILAQWRTGKPDRNANLEMREFIEEHLPQWSVMLNRSKRK